MIITDGTAMISLLAHMKPNPCVVWRSSRRPQRLSPWRLYVLLYFIARSVDVSFADKDSFILSRKECFAYGCPNYPRDVSFDESVRKALASIVIEKNHDDKSSYTSRSRALQQLESCGDDDKVTMTMMGYKGGSRHDQINQDRSFVLSPFRLNEDIPNTRLLGVFDGHSYKGELVSQYAVEQVPRRLSAKLDSYLTKPVMSDPEKMEKEVKRALVETFVEIDKDLPTKREGGCTASVVLQLGSKLYVANAGDSQTFVLAHLASTNETKVIYVSREDKPDLPEERARIEEMGGRVNIPDEDEDDSPRAIMIDPDTGYWYGVAMSRSIGDWDVTGVIADPIVDVLDIEGIVASMLNDETSCPAEESVGDEEAKGSETCMAPTESDINIFAVSATDGMMDFLDHDVIAESFAKAFYANDDIHPLTVCKDLIMEAAAGWNSEYDGTYRDDIAVASCKLSTLEDQ